VAVLAAHAERGGEGVHHSHHLLAREVLGQHLEILRRLPAAAALRQE
jgi:hypothetical protein